jgi:hypothetical protein
VVCRLLHPEERLSAPSHDNGVIAIEMPGYAAEARVDRASERLRAKRLTGRLLKGVVVPVGAGSDEPRRLLRGVILDLVRLGLAEVEPEFVSWR